MTYGRKTASAYPFKGLALTRCSAIYDNCINGRTLKLCVAFSACDQVRFLSCSHLLITRRGRRTWTVFVLEKFIEVSFSCLTGNVQSGKESAVTLEIGNLITCLTWLSFLGRTKKGKLHHCKLFVMGLDHLLSHSSTYLSCIDFPFSLAPEIRFDDTFRHNFLIVQYNTIIVVFAEWVPHFFNYIDEVFNVLCKGFLNRWDLLVVAIVIRFPCLSCTLKFSYRFCYFRTCYNPASKGCGTFC